MSQKKRIAWFLTALALVIIPFTAWAKPSHGKHRNVVGAVYTMTNDAVENSILVFNRTASGRLTPAGSYSTGGLGTGGGLGNQSGVILSPDQRWLYAVNAGSNEISVFAVKRNRLQLVDRINTGGNQPVSLALDRKILYVLHAGTPNNITGFTVGRHGRLSHLPGSTRSLSAADTGPAQISFSPDGSALVVTEKGTNLIDVYTVDRHGLAEGPTSYTSPGTLPFGFAFGKREQLFVSEAVSGTVSSYQLDDDGTLQIISPAVATNQAAACWVVVTNNGRFAYTTNAASGSISGFHIDHNGTLELLDADGRTGVTGDGSAPIDMALSGNSRFLYALGSGNGTISAFRVNLRDGSLKPIPGASGLPAGVNGLAAR